MLSAVYRYSDLLYGFCQLLYYIFTLIDETLIFIMQAVPMLVL